jgi:hypothetical protein
MAAYTVPAFGVAGQRSGNGAGGGIKKKRSIKLLAERPADVLPAALRRSAAS